MQKDEGEIFPCPLCDYKAKWRHHIPIHIGSMHGGIKLFCPHCEYTASQKNNLTQHMKAKHEGEIFSCSLCSFKTSWKRHLNDHVKAEHEGRLFSCEKCEYTAKWSNGLKNHIKTIHDGVHKNETYHLCKQCDYKTINKSSLKIHVKSVHETQTYKCKKCFYKSKCKEKFENHVTSKHVFRCQHCKYESTRKDSLEIHMKKSHALSHGESKAKSLPLNRNNMIKDECEYFEVDVKQEDEFELNIKKIEEDADAAIVKLESTIENFEETNINVETKNPSFEQSHSYVCPISSCVFFINENNRVLEMEHFKSNHPNIINNNLTFLKLL